MNLATKTFLSIVIATFLCSLHGLAQNRKTHKVASGETAYSIAKSNNVTLKELYALNPKAEQGVKIGEDLYLPQSTTANPTKNGHTFHTIEKKETLYSVSRKYSVSMQDIMDANAGLTPDTFTEGKVIRIPIGVTQEPEKEVNYLVYKVRKGETIYSIAQSYNITANELINVNPSLKSELKKGSFLKIPQYSIKKITEQDVAIQEEKGSNLLKERSKITPIHTVKIGLLLPFLDKNEKQSNRFTEYMQGFLLAVEDFKRKGYAAEVYIFDIGSNTNTKRLEELLETVDIRSLNVLIGGVSQEQIKVLADFSQKQKIRYVIPFSSKNEEVLSKEYVFQINTPYDDLYPRITQTFASRFKMAKVLIVNESNSDKVDFISALKAQLQNSNILHTSIQLADDTASELSALMSKTKPNILVPSSSSPETINKLASILQTIKKDNPDLQISLFGYPEWQTYGSSVQEKLYKYDSYFFTPFFVGNEQTSGKQFAERFISRYDKKLMNLYPKYGLLGYDTGSYFLNAAKLYGVNFENHLGKYQANSVQSALSFTRTNNWGGFINTGFYFVHCGTSSTEKTKYDK